MFLNNSLRISLKIRLVLIYSLLFIISCSLIFAVASYRIYHEINRTGDKEALHISRNMQEVYNLSIQSPQPSVPELPGEEGRRNYPASDRAVLEKRFPGMELLAARLDNGPVPEGKSEPLKYHTASIYFQGKYYTCRVRQDGSVYSKLVKEPSNLMQLRLQLHAKPVKPNPLRSLKRRFAELARSRGHKGFIAVIRDSNTGKTILHTGENLSKHQKVLAGDHPEDTAFEVGSFRYLKSDSLSDVPSKTATA